MSFITPFSHYFSFFRTYTHNRIFILVFIAIASTVFEGLGITLFFPLLQQGRIYTEGSEENLSFFFNGFFEILNIPQSLGSILLVIVIIFSIKGIMVVLLDSYRGYLLADVYKLINNRMTKAYTGMDYQYYLEQNTGFLNNLMTVEVNQVEAAFNRFCQLLSELITASIFLCISFSINLEFTLMALFFGGCIFLLMKIVFRLSQKWSKERAYINARLQKLLIQTIQSFKYLTATSQFRQLRSKIFHAITEKAHVQFKLTVITALPGLSEALMVTTVAAIIYYQVTITGQPLASLIISIMLLYRLTSKMINCQGYWQSFCSMMGSIDMVSETLEALEKNKDLSGSTKIKYLSDAVSFNKVSFSFGETLIIKNISLKIKKYSMVAIVGSSGAGKSTIVDLLTNILKPTKGEIFIDGINQHTLDMLEFRKRIGYVTQESVVFDDSVANNINLWDSSLDEKQCSEKVKKAARQALCEGFILETASGYNTLIGDRGIKLSGGQRQRLSIARELYKEPDIMILDEATSSLDSEAEKYIQESVDQLKGKITMIIIAHRLSTIRNCDYIYVLEKGEIVEKGTFIELISNQNSKFNKMCLLQNLQAL